MCCFTAKQCCPTAPMFFHAPRVLLVLVGVSGKGDNKLGKLLERVRADALAGKDTDVWCSMRFQLAGPLDVAVDFAVTKAGQVVAEPTFEGKAVVRMGEIPRLDDSGRSLRVLSSAFVFFLWVSSVS